MDCPPLEDGKRYEVVYSFHYKNSDHLNIAVLRFKDGGWQYPDGHPFEKEYLVRRWKLWYFADLEELKLDEE